MSLAALVLKLQFWFMILLLAKHRARLEMQRQQRQTDRQTDRKVSNHKNEEYFRLCTPPTSLPFFTRPITANFSTSRQAVVAEPLACDSRNQDNADTSYPKRDTTPRDATRMYSISLASLCPTTKTRLETHLRSNTVSSQLTEPPPVRPSRGQTSPL
jgi:hypothetical protein